MTKHLHQEIDTLKEQMKELKQFVQQALPVALSSARTTTLQAAVPAELNQGGAVYYSGHIHQREQDLRWEPKERSMEQLLAISTDKGAKVLAALGHKQRLEILKSVLTEPATGAELVERLGMGTTGQLYHHLKALIAANLLVQEPQGKYIVPAHRRLPFLLLLAAASDLLDASDYLDMAEARDQAGSYFGHAGNTYDPHHLLWAVVENSILEYKAGHCSTVEIYLHSGGSFTVTDDGRGIPVSAMPDSGLPSLQSILTDIGHMDSNAPFQVPGAEKGISIAVINALSLRLTAEIRRDGHIYRQEYKHGIPISGLLTVGKSDTTGTSMTVKPDPGLFPALVDPASVQERMQRIQQTYPKLNIALYN